MSRVASISMDAISLDDWELLPEPDHRSSSFLDAECSSNNGVVGGGKDQFMLGAEMVLIDMDHFGPASSHPPLPHDYCILDEETKKPLLLLPSEYASDGSDLIAIDDVMAAEPEQEEEEVTEILIYEAEEEEDEKEMIESSAPAVGVEQAADQLDDGVLVEAAAPADGVSGQCAVQEEEEEEGVGKIGFAVGSLRVSGVGALCSFGVAAATFCILLLGGNGKQQQQQQLQKRQDHHHKIQFQQMCAGDERIQQVVQQASRLNQTMSSVMGGASSARASISFGGYYQGF